MSWSEGRYQTRKFFPDNPGITDLTGVAGDIESMPVLFPKIELRTLELSHDMASAAVTTAAELDVARINVNAIWGAAVGNTDVLGTVTVSATAIQYEPGGASLDPNADDIHTPAAFPVAYRGDIIVLRHTVQGDGTQSGRVQLKYRELENRVDEIDGPTA